MVVWVSLWCVVIEMEKVDELVAVVLERLGIGRGLSFLVIVSV